MMKMDDRDNAEFQNWGKKDIDVILEFVLSRKRQNAIVSSPTLKMKTKNVLGRGEIQNVRSSSFVIFFLEREKLLSKFPADPTVRILRDKKESCSTRRGLRVGSGFREFRHTPRGRGFILLEFYTLFKCIYDV